MEHPSEFVDERSASPVYQAVIATTPEGVVVAWNPNAETLYGWTAAEAIGRSIVELTPSEQATGDAGNDHEDVASRASHGPASSCSVARTAPSSSRS